MAKNHRICGDCWLRLHFKTLPDGSMEFRPPVMMRDCPTGLCCFCPNMSQLGIFVRANQKDLPGCESRHEEEEKEDGASIGGKEENRSLGQG